MHLTRFRPPCLQYARDFADWDSAKVIPEACVLDVIRCRIVFSSGQGLLKLQQELARGSDEKDEKSRGFTVDIGGRQTLKIELIRMKNKFDPKQATLAIQRARPPDDDANSPVGTAALGPHLAASTLELRAHTL